jgi:hypothetical protein
MSIQQASDPPHSNYSNLSAGSLAEPGIYVVSHRVHVVPHEVIIRRPMILPHCKICGNVRYSWKCSLPQDIEESDFFFDVNPVPISLFARVLANAAAYCRSADASGSPGGSSANGRAGFNEVLRNTVRL